MIKKDLSFLENEYLQFLLMNYFIGENDIELNTEYYTYLPKGKVSFISPEDGEKVDIESSNISDCAEMYTSLKDSKIIKQITMTLNGKNITIDFVLKTSPLRITGILAPKSLAEEFDDKVMERLLYFDLVKQFYQKTLKSFLELRISDDWRHLLKNFEDYLSKIV